MRLLLQTLILTAVSTHSFTQVYISGIVMKGGKNIKYRLSPCAERISPYSLRHQGGPVEPVRPSYLQDVYKAMKYNDASQSDSRSVASHAFYGDLLLRMVATEHVDHKFHVKGEWMNGMSEHQLIQPYIARKSQASFFNFVRLTDLHDDAHWKADQVEALISFLDLLRAQPPYAEMAKKQLDAICRWILHYGDTHPRTSAVIIKGTSRPEHPPPYSLRCQGGPVEAVHPVYLQALFVAMQKDSRSLAAHLLRRYLAHAGGRGTCGP